MVECEKAVYRNSVAWLKESVVVLIVKAKSKKDPHASDLDLVVDTAHFV